MRGTVLAVLVLAASVYGVGYWMSHGPGTASKGRVGALLDEEEDSERRIIDQAEALAGVDGAPALEDLERVVRRYRVDLRSQDRFLEASMAGTGTVRENLVVAASVGEGRLSGPAVLTEMVRILADSHLDFTVRCVWLSGAGSLKAYETDLQQRGERVRGWIVLDSVGRFASGGTKQFWPWYTRAFQDAGPEAITFQAGIGSRSWMETVVRDFRIRARLPSAVLCAPECWLSMGITPWKEAGADQVFVSDTGPWRGVNREDPSSLNGPAMAQLTHGLAATVVALSRRNQPKL